MLPDPPRYPTRARFNVFWGDMDALGHVNNTVYLRWFEEARIQYWRAAGLFTSAGGVILAHQRIDYLAPVTYPDVVEVKISVVKIGTRSLTMGFVVSSEAQKRDVARGEGVGVAFDYSRGESVPIPDEIRRAVFEYERSVPEGGSI